MGQRGSKRVHGEEPAVSESETKGLPWPAEGKREAIEPFLEGAVRKHVVLTRVGEDEPWELDHRRGKRFLPPAMLQLDQSPLLADGAEAGVGGEGEALEDRLQYIVWELGMRSGGGGRHLESWSGRRLEIVRVRVLGMERVGNWGFLAMNCALNSDRGYQRKKARVGVRMTVNGASFKSRKYRERKKKEGRG